MKKYKVTGIPKAQDGKVAPPSPENAVDVSGSEYPSFWNTQSTMVNPQVPQFPTYEVEDQGLGDRTIQEQINTLPNIYGDDPYNDYYKDLNTGEAMQCPEGMAPFKGKCFPEETFFQLHQKLMDEEKEFNDQTWYEKVTLPLDKFRAENYYNRYENSKKHDKIEPWQTLKGENLRRMDPNDVNTLMQYYKLNNYYIEEKSNGDVQIYPRDIIEDRIINNAFKGRNFKSDWGLNQKQIEEEYGELMKFSDEVYSAGMMEEIWNKAMKESKTIGEVINEFPEKGPKGYKEEIRKRFQGKLNDEIKERWETVKKDMLKGFNANNPLLLGNEEATDDETAYAIASGKGPINITPGMFDNDPEFQEFKRKRGNNNLLPRKKFDFYSDRNREFTVLDSWLSAQDPNTLTPEKLAEGQEYYEKNKNDIGDDSAVTVPVTDPLYQYDEDWVSRGKTEADRKERRRKLEEIRNKVYPSEIAEGKDPFNKLDDLSQISDINNLKSWERGDRLGLGSDWEALRTEEVNRPVQQINPEMLKAEQERLRAEELDKLTGRNKAYTEFIQSDPNFENKLKEIQKKALNNPDLTLEDLTLFASGLERYPSSAFNHILDPGLTTTGSDAISNLFSPEAYNNYVNLLNLEENQPVFKQGRYKTYKPLSDRDKRWDKLSNFGDWVNAGLESFLGSSGKSTDEIMYGSPIYDEFGNQYSYNELDEINRKEDLGDDFYGNRVNSYNPTRWLDAINLFNIGDEIYRDPSLNRAGELFWDAATTLAPMGKLAKPAMMLRNLNRGLGKYISPFGFNFTKALSPGSRYTTGQMFRDFNTVTQPYFLRETFKDDGYLDQFRENLNVGNYRDAAIAGLGTYWGISPGLRGARNLLRQRGTGNILYNPQSKFAMGYQSPLSKRQYFYGNPNLTNPTSIIPRTSGWLGRRGIPFDIRTSGTPSGNLNLKTLNYNKGGMVLKLDQNEINQYIKDGYVIEDV